MSSKWPLPVTYVSEYYCGTWVSVCPNQRKWNYESTIAELSRKIWVLLKGDISQFLNIGKQCNIICFYQFICLFSSGPIWKGQAKYVRWLNLASC